MTSLSLYSWWSRYCQVSTRTLALWRITVGLTALLDTVYYWRSADVFYSASGVISLDRSDRFSPIALLDSTWQLNAYFAATALACLCLALGVRGAKWVTPWLTACYAVAAPDLMTGGHSVIQLAIVYMWLLPVDENWSIHSWLKSKTFTGTSAIVRAVGYPLVLLQLAVNYSFNTINKFTNEWEQGVAIQRALGNPMTAKPLGAWLVQAPDWVLESATYGTLFLEGMLPLLLLAPIFRRRAHLLAAILMLALHGMIVATLEVGYFGWAMLCQVPLLLLHPKEGAGATPLSPRVHDMFRIARGWGAAVLLYALLYSLGHPQNPAGFNPGGKFNPVPNIEGLTRRFAWLDLVQGWGMFAHPIENSYVTITHAETAQGRFFDPWRYRAADDERAIKHLPRAAYKKHMYLNYEALELIQRRVTSRFSSWVLRQSPHDEPGNSAVRFATWSFSVPSEKRHQVAAEEVDEHAGMYDLPLEGTLPVTVGGFGVWEPGRTIDGRISEEGSQVMTPTGSSFTPGCAHLTLTLKAPTHLRAIYLQTDGFDEFLIEGSLNGKEYFKIGESPKLKLRQYRSRLVSLDAPGVKSVRLRKLQPKPRQGFINEVALFDEIKTMPSLRSQENRPIVASFERPAALGQASAFEKTQKLCPWGPAPPLWEDQVAAAKPR